MTERITGLVMVTPFESSISLLGQDEQLVMLKGCALCRITRDVDRDNTRSKAEWKTCRQELGLPIEVLTIDSVDAATLSVIEGSAPAVCALTEAGRRVLLLDRDALERCRGSVTDFRGRLLYRIAAAGLVLPDAET